MFSKEETIQIAAPPEQVFDYVSDLRKHPDWADKAIDMEVRGESIQEGTTFHTVSHYLGGETCEGKVLEMQRPSTFAYECDTSSSGRYIWRFRLTPSNGGTRLSHSFERLTAPAWFKVVQPVMWPFIGRSMVANGLKNIKAKVEAGAGKQAAT
jgi:uncharacterized protein YndB with AHSA1/START domain